MGRKKGVATKGQPTGARSASGRLRNRTPGRVDPCEGIIRRRDIIGVPSNDTDTCDAIGRAYAAGFLGGLGEDETRDRAKRLLNAGRTIAWQYWRIYAPQFGTPDSLARYQPQEPRQAISDEDRASRERIIEAALNDGLKLVRDKGHDCKRAFEQLVIDLNPDRGPAPLDRLLWARKQGEPLPSRDEYWLRLAVKGLEALA